MTAESAAGASLEKCRECALRLLDQRPHSIAELRLKLQRRKFDRSVIGELISGFERLGLLNDRLLARNYCEFKLTGGTASGRRKILQEMCRHGIPREIAEGALEQVWDRDGRQGELERARAAAAPKMRLLRKETDRRVVYSKIARFLVGRGFPPDICGDVARGCAAEIP